MKHYGLQRPAGPLVFIIIVLFFPWSTLAQPKAGSCVGCHLMIGVEKLSTPAKDFAQDIHSAKGFGCVSCHGGDSTNPGMGAMDPTKGYIGKPNHGQIPAVCGRCHSDAQFLKRYNPALRVDQVTEYYTSVHGQRLKQLGDPKVATCVSCHSAHSIKPASEPTSRVHPLKVANLCGSCHADRTLMKPYGITTNQLQEYKKSIHWKKMRVEGDLSAPTCNDCHGNHGATPPGISWVGNVCGQCHAVMAQLFARSVHAKVFIQMGTPGCATCHGNHEVAKAGDEMLGIADGAVCAACHSAESQGGKAAVAMRKAMDSLRDKYDKGHGKLLEAERAGMEVSQAQFQLNNAKDALVKGRTAVHSFSVEAVTKEIEVGLGVSNKAYARGVEALHELQFRRRGLAVSVGIILILIVGLVIKIRQLERKR